jgi:hypothetical protein
MRLGGSEEGLNGYFLIGGSHRLCFLGRIGRVEARVGLGELSFHKLHRGGLRGQQKNLAQTVSIYEGGGER